MAKSIFFRYFASKKFYTHYFLFTVQDLFFGFISCADKRAAITLFSSFMVLKRSEVNCEVTTLKFLAELQSSL